MNTSDNSFIGFKSFAQSLVPSGSSVIPWYASWCWHYDYGQKFRDCYHHIAISILLTFNLNLEIEQMCHWCSSSNLLDFETSLVSNVDCTPTSLWSPHF